MYSEVLTGGEN